MFFGSALIVAGWEVVGWGKKSCAEIASFFSQDFRRSNTHDTFWHAVSTGYFYVLFLWPIAVPDVCPSESYKAVGLPLSTIIFVINSQSHNSFYKYIYLSQILYSKNFEKIVSLNKFYIIFHFLSLCVFISIQNIGQSISLNNIFWYTL